MSNGYWRSKKVLVAGGAGFLGSYLVEELVQDGAKVVVVDKIEKGQLRNLTLLLDAIEFIQGDLLQLSTCVEVTRGMDVVLNLAGKTSGIGYSVAHHGELFTANSLLCLNLVEAARRNGVPRLLIVSSSCVYPDNAPTPTPELAVNTGWPETANEGYGWAKRMAELQAQYYAKEHNMQIAVVRPFNPYGKRYRWEGEKSHVIPMLVKKVCDGEDPVVVWGSGNQRRNFIHVRDAARIMKLITERYACADPVNIGFEDTISMRDLVEMIMTLVGKQPKVVFDRTRPEGRIVKSADASKLKAITGGLFPTVSLDDGLREMIEWYEENFGRSAGAV